MFPKRRAVAIHYGVPRKSVDQEWQKDLLRFLPKGQGDIKCQHVYSSLVFYRTLVKNSLSCVRLSSDLFPRYHPDTTPKGYRTYTEGTTKQL
jgi:hypothetical protein